MVEAMRGLRHDRYSAQLMYAAAVVGETNWPFGFSGVRLRFGGLVM